jgi:outer membrane protein OmpA-like peptidoglycan-associated protein
VPTPGQPVRSASYLDGQIRLAGAVPDSRVASGLRKKWAAAFGKGNVTTNLVIAVGVPLPETDPLDAHAALQFPPLSAELQPAALQFLDRLALLLQQNPKVTLDIDAHTDGVGQAAANQQLSEFRAGAVVIYLAGKGIDPARLHATGHGGSSPVADDASEAGRNLNRRVEFTVHHLLD